MTHSHRSPEIETPLLPCPFCGGEDVELWTGFGTQADISCQSCGCERSVQVADMREDGEEYPSFDEATFRYPGWLVRRTNEYLVSEWNTRAPSPCSAGIEQAGAWVNSAYDELCVRFSGVHSDDAMDSVLLRLHAALKKLGIDPTAPYIAPDAPAQCAGCDGHECDNGCQYPNAAQASTQRTPLDLTAPELNQIATEAFTRAAVIEECAKFVEQNQESIRETSHGSERYLSPRKVGNQMGLAYVDGIRALALPSKVPGGGK